MKEKFSIGKHALNDIILNARGVDDYHARLVVLEDGMIILEDHDSRNGTFVNGMRIKRKVVTETDQILLGNMPFTLGRYLVLKEGKVIKARAKDDFSEEFLQLQEEYARYIEAKEKIEKKQRQKDLLYDPLLAIPVAGIFLRNAARSLTSAKKKTVYTEALQNLRYEFQQKYRCPNPECSKPFGEVPWHTLAGQKRCERCGAIWIKE